MTRKNYVRAAEILSGLNANGFEVSGYEELCNAFADMFAADNSRFDRERFLTACGL